VSREPLHLRRHPSTNLLKHTNPNPIYQSLIERFNARLLALADAAGPESVLEVGCGEGFVLKYLADRRSSWRWAGSDIGADAILYARSHCPAAVALLVADIRCLPFPPAAFDLVICSEVLEHLADTWAALTELQRVSRRHVLITVPREPYFRILTRLAIWSRFGLDPGHIRHWSDGSFRRLMKERFGEVLFVRSSLYQLALGSEFHSGYDRETGRRHIA
jgi:SAM-dependent methyltransferase